MAVRLPSVGTKRARAAAQAFTAATGRYVSAVGNRLMWSMTLTDAAHVAEALKRYAEGNTYPTSPDQPHGGGAHDL